MHILLPDPHPGRCNNFRWSPSWEKNFRCLEAEGTPHQCRFDIPLKHTVSTSWAHTHVVTPEPWVVPPR